ncbi:hypothetical protein [Neobacillus niacini]|uniref:hypothetical protein n=1 Tax=Neobacillus niacini TaxID=86668 RepID=UPI00286C441D|nr:hypothetical protein [Neobacillus niacini]
MTALFANGTNFYHAEVNLDDEGIYILRNGSYPFFAFASKVEYMNIHFMDYQTLSKEIVAFNKDYRDLTTSELYEPIQPDGRKLLLRTKIL